MWENKATAKGLIIAAHGMLPILEILEPCNIKSDQHMILNFLQIINYVSWTNVPSGPMSSFANCTDHRR